MNLLLDYKKLYNMYFVNNDFPAAFEQIQQEDREERVKEIKIYYARFQEKFNSMIEQNKKIYEVTSNNILIKMRSIKEVNLIHQITLMELFVLYCDAKFYHSFKTCSDSEAPYLTSSFLDLIDTIIGLKWSALDNSNPESN